MIEIYNQILFYPLLNLLVFLTDIVPGHDVGWAIIIMTIIVRLILLPFSIKSVKSQKALQELQPKIEEIRRQNKEDKEKQTQELMKFYKENKVNPFSSCLPMLVQLPIIFALYQVFRQGLTMESLEGLYSFVQAPSEFTVMFLGFLDLATPNIWLAVLAGVAQFFQSKMLLGKQKNKKQTGIQGAIGKQMVYFMPIMTVFIAMSLPSGLALYWLTTTIFAIVQQLVIMRDQFGWGKKEEVKGKVV